jgi:hypothetical protein
MAGCQILRPRGGRFAAAITLCLALIANRAAAQEPSPLSGIPVHRPVRLAATTQEPIAGPTTVHAPTYYADVAPTGYSHTWAQSIFGKTDADSWRPLTLSTFFSDGWNESWVPSPNGSGGAPRQGWINAADGNLYRLGFMTFAQGFNDPPKGNAYLGAFTLLTPLNRRMELITNVPYVIRNSAAEGLPISGSNQLQQETTQSHTTFGDISLTPRFLLHETQDFSLTAEFAFLIPTGSGPLAGNTSITPAISFWHNLCGGWVIRGGAGVAFPLEGSGADTLIGQLAIGQTITPHDVRWFGDFTYYLSVVTGTPLSGGDGTSVALTPGIRTHVGNDWYFLAGVPVPVTTRRVADLGLILWFMKAW